MAESETHPRAAVIALSGYRTGGALSALDDIERYWTQLRDDQGGLPSRTQLDPRGFSRALSNCFVAEAMAPRHLRLRLTGQHMTDLMGMDMRGMPLSAMILPESRPELEDKIEALMTGDGTALRLTLISPRSYNRAALFAGMLLLPLARENGTPAKILGALATVGTVGWTPRRFQILGETANPAQRPALAEGESGRPKLTVIQGGVEEPEPAC
ncbi:PAS domain-containing protein [Rhodovulum sp. MB263]|uniref:PAS domain-containing protein n=1 Tax=unclassified Rhodovulum TaxID=2631432 RepID=UPI0018C8B2F6|nr:PAS domain-containing protein [Rhodovulum sp. MB263]